MENMTQENIDEMLLKASRMLRMHQEEIFKDIKKEVKPYKTLPELLQKNAFIGSILYGNNIIA